ncbi:MAG: hypothetical protein DRI84_01155 [Bacteroidetes bacterium]|nr:MAG: hypothetical protein DRI84_01155 [Bacteroidota bacterium]
MKLLLLIILSLVIITSCNKDQPLPDNYDNSSDSAIYSFELINEYLLDIFEPSGLSWALNHEDFIVVDDHTNQAFVIDKKGKDLSQFPYLGNDTEGVTIDEDANEFWIAEEAESKLIQLNASGVEMNSYKIDINRSSSKKGLEGLAYDSKNKIFYILNEGEPGLLIKWHVNGGIISQKQLQFAQDYSGIYFDNADQSLWVVSDQSQKLFYCDLNGEVKQSFDLDYQKAEGVVVDQPNNRVYIVSDLEHKLYIYKITKL